MFLSPYYRITPHLRSSSRRPKSFRGRGGERRGGSDESGRGGGGGERKREREIEFLGCILKPVELSGNCREAKSERTSVDRVQDLFSLLYARFSTSLFLSILSIYLYKRDNRPFRLSSFQRSSLAAHYTGSRWLAHL